jgi:diguanylate cyclase (GGDEF)-like protein
MIPRVVLSFSCRPSPRPIELCAKPRQARLPALSAPWHVPVGGVLVHRRSVQACGRPPTHRRPLAPPRIAPATDDDAASPDGERRSQQYRRNADRPQDARPGTGRRRQRRTTGSLTVGRLHPVLREQADGLIRKPALILRAARIDEMVQIEEVIVRELRVLYEVDEGDGVLRGERAGALLIPQCRFVESVADDLHVARQVEHYGMVAALLAHGDELVELPIKPGHLPDDMLVERSGWAEQGVNQMLSVVSEMGRRCVKKAGDVLWQWALRLESLACAAIIAIGLSLMVVITLVDAFVKSGAGYDEFYLLPIVSAAWLTRSTAGGVAMAALAVALRMINDVVFHSVSIPLAMSEAVVHLLLYLGVVLLLGLVRRDRDLQEALAVTDSLTGVANARFLRTAALTELERSRRYGHALSLTYIDIDDFKAVNDTFGHQEGDRILKRVATIAKNSIRSIDVLARLGGDEFVVLMPETGPRNARGTAKRLSRALDGVDTSGGSAVTCSVGLVTYRDLPRTVEDLLSGGDDVMYEAKSAGKNLVRHMTIDKEPVAIRP